MADNDVHRTMYVRLTPFESTKHPREIYAPFKCTNNQAATSSIIGEAAAWFAKYSLFLLSVLLRGKISEFFEYSVKIFLVIVSDYPRNRRSPAIGRL